MTPPDLLPASRPAACFPFRRTTRARLVIALVAGLAVATTATHRASGIIVFDPANYSQNLLTAARALQEIENQIKSLQNEAQMLINQAKNLAQMPQSVASQLKSNLDEINRLMAEAKGITFDVQKTTQEFERIYPKDYTAASSSNGMIADANARWTNTYEALRQTLQTQSKIVEGIASDGSTLQSLMNSSSGAIGALQAQQAGNELIGLGVKQSLQTQALIAAQSRSDALKSAEEKITSQAAKERFTRFIGDGRAYSGQAK
jgi:type IV secretion system protein TrbJ